MCLCKRSLRALVRRMLKDAETSLPQSVHKEPYRLFRGREKQAQHVSCRSTARAAPRKVPVVGCTSRALRRRVWYGSDLCVRLCRRAKG